ncbi:hypothetical protein [Labilibaculum antarcticum]|uniref:Uncharacterized protein n=1 Tax=Labilibaculum antarcticum TaxID=1717717 RepID=A0A1Y1CM09_9BACT|nr:hypothetical protein [Labilibaculum antarcticum]BAX81469.1 hypothetical protein ALGA_3169 [Labilibaculum antarcticum]
MTPLKYLYKRKSESIVLWILTIISVFLIFKSSDDPLLPLFEGGIFESIFYQFSYGNIIIQTITLGFLVSLIFYLIVVYIPAKRKEKDVNPYVKIQCESIIFTSYAIIDDIISKSDSGYDFKNLTNEQFKEICENVNPIEHISKFHNDIGKYFDHHLGYKIYNRWIRIEEEMNNLLKLLPHIDTGILKKIYNLKNCTFRILAKDLSQVEKFQNDNLNTWSEHLYEVYTLTKDLRDYSSLYFKTDLKNDPWNK